MRAADRPEPLWRPVYEEEEPVSSSEDCKPSVSKPSVSTQGDTSPPSPRTLKAIQAAMSDGSDEEKVDPEEKDGNVSPRTLLAIQRALAEEEAEEEAAELKTLTSQSAAKPQVVLSSSEEETESNVLPSLSKEISNFKEKPTSQILHNNLFVISSEDEMEEVIGQRNKAFVSAGLQQPHDGSERQKDAESRREIQMKLAEETKEDKLIDVMTGRDEQTEKHVESRRSTSEPEEGQPQGAVAFHQSSLNTTSTHVSAQPCAKPLRDTGTLLLLSEQRNNESIVLQEKNGGHVKPESSEESESEGNSL